MKSLALFSGLLTGMILTTSVCFAEVAVIVNPANAAISNEDISGVFLPKMKSFPGGGSAIPVNQEQNAAVTKVFNDKVVNKTDQQLKAYWSKLVFTGQGTPPREVSSDAEVIKLVADNPNIIGYVDSAAVTGGVKVIATY
jgi:hypothetical protein